MSNLRRSNEGKQYRGEGNKKNISASLNNIIKLTASHQDKTADMPQILKDLVPTDGLYHADAICDILGITRQALCYHTSDKRSPTKRLYYVKRTEDKPYLALPNAPRPRGRPPGAKPFFVTAVEFLRFLIVHSYQIPPQVYTAVDNYNRHYGNAEAERLKQSVSSPASGVDTAPLPLPQQGRTLPKPTLFAGPPVDPTLPMPDAHSLHPHDNDDGLFN